VLWALHALRSRGRADGVLDLARAVSRTHERWRREPDLMRGIQLPSAAEAGLLTGESGILMTAWLVEPTAELAERLHERIRENADNEAIEIMWGAPGTMLAAAELHRRTGEARWADAWRESAGKVLAARTVEGLWESRLYGEVRRSLTPPHGIAGNVHALLDGGDLLDAEMRRMLQREASEVLRRTAVVEDGLATWPAGAADGPRRRGRRDPASVVRRGTGHRARGRGVSRRGPAARGGGARLAGGRARRGEGRRDLSRTAGNGYALLRTFERTGDERWLDRARRFATHALEQVERREGRFSLWTGDLGVALFASDCIDARARYPVLETWG
jgi:hypothetical protein